MTPTLTDKEVIVHLAEKVMGWKPCDRRAMGWGNGPDVWITGEDTEDPNSNPTFQGFNPLELIEHAFLIEEKIPADKRGEYVFTLAETVCPEGIDRLNVYEIHWRMVHATPRQRCQAAYEATKP